MFGYKNHIGTNRRYGLIRSRDVTDAARYDRRVFRHLPDKRNFASPLGEDTAYRPNKNKAYMARNGFTYTSATTI